MDIWRIHHDNVADLLRPNNVEAVLIPSLVCRRLHEAAVQVLQERHAPMIHLDEEGRHFCCEAPRSPARPSAMRATYTRDELPPWITGAASIIVRIQGLQRHYCEFGSCDAPYCLCYSGPDKEDAWSVISWHQITAPVDQLRDIFPGVTCLTLHHGPSHTRSWLKPECLSVIRAFGDLYELQVDLACCEAVALDELLSYTQRVSKLHWRARILNSRTPTDRLVHKERLPPLERLVLKLYGEENHPQANQLELLLGSSTTLTQLGLRGLIPLETKSLASYPFPVLRQLRLEVIEGLKTFPWGDGQRNLAHAFKNMKALESLDLTFPHYLDVPIHLVGLLLALPASLKCLVYSSGESLITQARGFAEAMDRPDVLSNLLQLRIENPFLSPWSIDTSKSSDQLPKELQAVCEMRPSLRLTVSKGDNACDERWKVGPTG